MDNFPKYPHHYEDGRIIEARAYPDDLLAILKKFFVETWLKDKSYKYFSEREPNAVPFLQILLSLPNYREVMGYIELKSEEHLSNFNQNLKKAIDYKPN